MSSSGPKDATAPIAPSARQALLLYAVVMALYVAAAMFLGAQSPALRAALIGPLVVLLPAVLAARLAGVDFRRTFRLRAFAPVDAVLTVAVTIAAFPWLTEALHVLTLLIDPGGTGGWDAREVLREDLKMLQAEGWTSAILAFAVLPGISEEALFRGFLLTGFERAAGRAGAVCACALLFGLLHMIPARILATTALGLLFGFVGMTTRSLGPSILAHTMNNTLVILCAKLPALAGVPWLHGEAHVPGLALAPCAVVLCIGVLVMLRRRPAESSCCEPGR